MCDPKPKSKLLWRLVSLLCVLISVTHKSSACPKSCACYAPTEVHCTFRYLSEIPRDIQRTVERMNLGYNSLTALTVNDLSGLNHLELLMLHSNAIKTIEDSSFLQLTSLQVLKMSYNQVEKLDKDTFQGLHNLVRLHMDHNHITFIHPQSFYGLKMLQLVNLEGNMLQQLHPDTFISLRYSQIFKISSLRTIYLSDNALTSLPATVFAACYKLENLFLSGNPWSCDCKMAWIGEWTEKNPDVLKCKRDRKIGKEQLCPVCEYPVSSKGNSIVRLPNDGYTCIRPWIHPQLKQRNVTLDEGDYIPVSPTDFVAPIGMLEMNITDQFNNVASISCVVQRPVGMDNLTVTYGVNGRDVSALNATVLTSLVCNIDNDHLSQIWNILALYSELPMRLERGLKLSDTVYTYKQMAPTAPEEVFTEIKATIKVNPTWLMQSMINLQLDRSTTTIPTLTLKYFCNVHIDVDSSKDSRAQNSWTMIRRDNQTKTEHSVVAGRLVELNCQILGDPKPTIEWILPDGNKIRGPYQSEDQRIVLTDKGRLTLKSAERSDTGVYHCIASNYLDVDVLAFRVTVLPLHMKEEEVNGVQISQNLGQNLLLDCISSGSPQPSVQWILPDQTVSDKSVGNRKLYRNGTLVIHGLTSQDTGFYRCLAANYLGADLLASQVMLSDDLSKGKKQGKIKKSGEVVQMMDDSQKRGSRYLPHSVSEESRRITSGRPYAWLQSRFHKVPAGRRGNGRAQVVARRVFNKATRKVDMEKFATFVKNSRNKLRTEETLENSKTLHDLSEGSGDGISEEELTTQTLEDVRNFKTVGVTIPDNSFLEEKANNASKIFSKTKEESSLVTITSYPYSHSQTHATPIMTSYTPSYYKAQTKDERTLNTSNSDELLNHSDVLNHTNIYERKINRHSGQPVTLRHTVTEVTDRIELLFSGDSEEFSTGATPLYNVQNPDVTHLEPESQTRFTSVTTTEKEQDEITFYTTQRIKSPHLLPGSTIISKHQIQIVPPKKKQSGKRRNFPGRRRIIRPSKISDIQSILDKFKHLSLNKEDSLTTEQMQANQSLVNPTAVYPISTEKLVLTTPGTHLSNSVKTVTDSQRSATMVHSILKESTAYTNSVKERELTKDAIVFLSTPITTTKSPEITQENVPFQRQFTQKWDLRESLSKFQNPFTLSNFEEQMTRSTATPERALTAVPFKDLQHPHKITSPQVTKDDIQETSTDDASGSFSYSEPDTSFKVIPLSTTRFPAFRELTTTTTASNALSASPTMKTELKQDIRFSGSHTRLWGNQKPSFERRDFKGRGQLKKITPGTPVITEVPDRSPTTKSTTAASQSQIGDVVVGPLYEPIREYSTINTDSGGWRNTVLSSTNYSEFITSTTQPTSTYRRPTVIGAHTTPQFQTQSNTKRIPVNVNMMSVQPTVYDQTHKDNFERMRPNASSGVPQGKSSERRVSSDKMIVQTTEQLYNLTPSPRNSDIGSLNAYDKSTRYDFSNTTRSESSSADFNYKPKIIGGKAASFTVLSNSDSFLPCNVTGNPEPTISWSRFSSTTGNMLSIKGKMGKFEVLKNGTLSIQRTNIKDQGQYICFAENEYGSDKLVVTLSVLAYPTRILEPKIRNIKVLAGKTAEVECKTEGRPVPIVSWILPDRTEVKSPNTVHGRVAVTSRGTLTIQDVSVFDRGHYKCFASNPGGTDTATVRLQVVAAPPVILEEKRQLVRADVGQNLFLPCTSHGDPQPTTHWVLHDGTIIWPLTSSHTKISVFSNGTLYLRNVAITESGRYECIATSSTGSEQRVVMLSVKRIETAPQIIDTSQGNIDMVYGGRLQLNCSAVGDPKPHIIWRLPSKALVDQSHRMGSRMKVFENGTLIIESVNEKDAGDYLCVARSKVGDDVQIMKVSVSMKPARIEPNVFSKKQVLYGNDLKVDCVAAGVPIPEISWGLPDGTLLNSAMQSDGTGEVRSKRYTLFNNGTLYLNKVEIGEEGDYTCYAENKLGKDKMHIHISVVTAVPRIQTPNFTYAKVKPGTNVRFDCKAIGEPRPMVFWMLPSKDIIAASNERYLVHTNGSLDIRDVKLADAGEYVCMARNAAGEENKVYKLDIDGNPPIINGFKQNRTVMKDIAVKYSRKLIDCKAEGFPPPKITWIMPDNIFLTAPYYGSRINVHSNGTLEIRNVRPSDKAEFICMAQNDGGEAVMLVQLEVTNLLMRPIFKNPFNERLVTRVGRTAVLNCSADGQPTPEIIWILPNKTRFSGGPDGGSRYHLGKDGTFVIHNSTKEDAGKYRCAAKNQAGYIEKLIVFEVFLKPYILTRPRGVIRSVSGEPLYLHCLTDGSKVRISWTMPAGHVLTRPQVNRHYSLFENGTLVIRETTVYDHGNYVCRAKNEVGEAVLNVPVIVMGFPPQIINGPPITVRVVAGVPVHLPCVANGIPKPDITWELPDKTVLSTLENGQLHHPHGTLIIQNPTRADSGNYKCTAINYLGRDTKITYMMVI
nr:immunoglobulin superfamily member 10 isoform X2 [Misgurnus anguillicaudatus]